MTEPTASHAGMPRAFTLALLLALAVVWFGTLGGRALIRPDEGRYAEIAREMVASGDWITPRLNGFKYFEKPALQYWATAAAFSAFGFTDWAARSWPALTGFLGVLLAFFAGTRILGPPAGRFGAALLAGSFLYALIGHALTLDMGVSFFLSAAVFAFAVAQRDGAGATERRNAMLAAWACAGLAVLSKGLIGIVLPAGALALYLALERDWRLLRRMHVFAGGALFLAITVPWFVLVSRANPEFFRFFFIQEHFERFLTRAHGRYQPMWYFVPILLAGLVPWTLALFPALARAWRRDPGAHFQPRRFLLAWCAVVFAFFSISSSKLASYILPIVPALALLTGDWLARAGRALPLVQAVAMALLGAAIAIGARSITGFGDAALPAELLRNAVPWLTAGGIALAAAGASAALLCWRAQALAATLVLSAGGLALPLLVLAGHGELTPVYSAYHAVERIRPALRAAGPAARFYMVNTFDHTLPYYLGRTVTMVGYRDELAVAIGWEPHRFIADLPSFARDWQREGAAFAMLPAAEFDALRATLGVPMRVIASDPRRVFVAKP